MRFSFDRCAPIALARMVRGYEGDAHLVRHHDEDNRFTMTTPDVEWITSLASDGEPLWIVVSGDRRILKNKAQRTVLDEARLPFFSLAKPWINLPIREQAWRFMKVWPDIVDRAETREGRLFEVHGGSNLKIDIIC